MAADGVDIVQGARDQVELSAKEVHSLGEHLHQIGEIMQGANLQPGKHDVKATKKLKDKMEIFKAYQAEIALERQAIVDRMNAEFEQMRKWRKDAGTEGLSLVEELDAAYTKSKELEALLMKEQQKFADEVEKARKLVISQERKDRKLANMQERFIAVTNAFKRYRYKAAPFSATIQCSFVEQKFKLKQASEAQRLMIEHHRNMRKKGAQGRLDLVERERMRRVLRACWLSLQEEVTESRTERMVFQLRRTHEDELLVLKAQVAQALGDEEMANALFAEQTRKMKDAYDAQELAEQQRDKANWETREAQDQRDNALAQKEEAERRKALAEAAQAKAEDERDVALAAKELAEKERDEALVAAKEAARLQAIAEADVAAKARRIASLQRMLAELGAESDSDCPPDERPPPYFVGDDGVSKAPRPRTRKERMGMAYRDAESARWEMKLALATCIDKDINHEDLMLRIRRELRLSEQEIDELRWANKVLVADVEGAAYIRAGKPVPESAVTVTDLTEEGRPLTGQSAMGLSSTPFAPSNGGRAPWENGNPIFIPADITIPGCPSTLALSPRFLVKTQSQPVFTPSLCSDYALTKGVSNEKVTLAPLRKRAKAKKPTQAMEDIKKANGMVIFR